MDSEPSPCFDPYLPPQAQMGSHWAEPTPLAPLLPTWVRLGFYYNVTLFGVAVVTILSHPPRWPGPAWPELVFYLFFLKQCAFMANLCFCFGPMLDGCARWVGLGHRILTRIIFVSGTVLAASLTQAIVIFTGWSMSN